MSTVIIEKYMNGICVEKLRLPIAPLQFLARLLPGRARSDLLSHGLDLDALLNDSISSSIPQWMDIEEKKIAKRIRISRGDYMKGK